MMQWSLPSADAAAQVAAPEWMAVTWFMLLAVLLAAYAILDGFDLGVGIVHFMAGRSAKDRAAQISAIGPVWDGNEVWLVVFGGALFAAFPMAYATIFSAFYLPLIVLLFCLILRAVSIELRHVFHGDRWKLLCDVAFSGASLLASVIFGVAVGAAMVGLPLGQGGDFAPDAAGAPGPIQAVLALVSPFSVATGVLAAALCAVHGAAYLGLRTGGQHQERCRRVGLVAGVVFLLAVGLVTALALGTVPAATRNMASAPALWLVSLVGAGSTAWALRSLLARRRVAAFVGTCLMAAALVGLFFAALYPNIVLAKDPAHSITLATASSSRFTLLMMFFVVLVAAPLVLAYTLITYGTFHAADADAYGEEGGH
ncbi:MAG: cytochrome d ubiquinol oxidase subunit II [Phycisphaerales bacterium]